MIIENQPTDGIDIKCKCSKKNFEKRWLPKFVPLNFLLPPADGEVRQIHAHSA